jgi:predicted nucleic acid-binding Zn ribbon protein
MSSNTPVDQTSESGVCHCADWCTTVNSSNKQQQRNNIKLWTVVHIFLAYSKRQKLYLV